MKGTLSDFLTHQKMQCTDTEEALLELVVALSHYTEEGNVLFPQVLLCDDLEVSLGLIRGSEPIRIGSGPKSAVTMRQALKRCAPLAHGNWIVYVQRIDRNFEYGVFRAPIAPTAIDVRDTILSLAEEKQKIRIIFVSQLAEKAVELVGSLFGCLHVYLSATPDDAPSPRATLTDFTDVACASVPRDIGEQASSFIRKTLSFALRNCHGTLLAVASSGATKISGLTEDGVIFAKPIDIVAAIREYHEKRSDAALSSLNAISSLVAGMVATDGIVLINDKAMILGYNFFITSKKTSTPKPSELVGGARLRAYNLLCKMVDSGKLRACYIQSSDGSAVFYGGKEK